jgi:hypothetical protein
LLRRAPSPNHFDQQDEPQNLFSTRHLSLNIDLGVHMSTRRPWLAYFVGVIFVLLGLTFVFITRHSSSHGTAALAAGFGQGIAMLAAGIVLLIDLDRAGLLVLVVAVLTTAIAALKTPGPFDLLWMIFVWWFYLWYRRWQKSQQGA